MTRVSRAWVRVTPAPNRREANASVVPRSLGRAMAIGPLVVLMVVGQWPPEVAGPHGCLLADRCGALVAGAAEEGVDLGFDGGLDDQAGAQAGDVFEDLDEVAAVGEQGVDFGADGLGGGYSTGHGRGTPSYGTWRFSTGPTPVIYLPRIRDATAESSSWGRPSAMAYAEKSSKKRVSSLSPSP
ncbi:hypothetical protein [Planomonospora sp. ID91781]|uniref:hypothetical protein n=1 Tax=Planomonospora sp. ID91781 TaxID=2738135 RepID=UPI0027DD3583|nr:hypothetical protein [Planomonospora sp. ID91781]